MPHDENESQIMLARIDERVQHLGIAVSDIKEEFSKMDTTFVRLQRYIHVERAVIGVISLVLLLLITYVFSKVVGHS